MYSRRIKLKRAVSALLITAAALALPACSDGISVGPSLPPSAFGGAGLKSYRLGVGDKVRLTVFGEPDLSGTFEINALGRVSLPLAGDVQAAGLDADALRAVATRRYSDGYLKNPRITVDVVGYRPIYVHGEVRTGGEFPYKTGLRLRDAVALAGGYTYRANQSYVLLSRSGLPNDAKVAMPTDMLVMPGDNIRVPERFF
ncbi:MAG: polysaccharide biosynthesis/export family protein [Hyphomicrobiaceae bacterium]